MAFRDLISRDRTSNIPVHQGDGFGRSLVSLRDDMNRLFHDFWGEDTWPALSGFGGPAFPAVDVIENDNDFKVKAEVRGMEPENIEVSVNEDCLTIKGERKEETRDENKKDNYLRREISYGSFCRTIVLPSSSDIEQAKATFRNGVLTVDIPKKAEAIGRERKLEISKESEEEGRAKH